MQKKLKTLGLLLFVFALTTAVGATYSADTASAKTVKAKKLKLKKKKLSIKVGEKKTLKVTVKPKKAKLTWKSSKKKIATVSKKGVVKGKKKGTTKITVTSGKKKATCKVTVKQTYSIYSVQVINSKVVRVTLNKAKKLTASDFALAKKSTGNGKNYRKLSVATVNQSKNKVYDLVLSKDYDADSDSNCIADEDYVRVSINKLNGIKVKEVIYYSSIVSRNEYIGGVTGDVVNENVYFTSSYKGYLTDVKVTGLPAGLKAKAYGNYVTIKGIPTAVSNGKAATMTAKDELGKSLTQKIYFYIGSANQIVSYIPFEGRTILANDEKGELFDIYAYGGSGSYTYTLINNKNPLINCDGSDIYFSAYRYNNSVKQYLSAGRYNVAYSVTDKGNAKIKSNGSLAVTAVNGVKITGKVVAGDNTVITGADVSATFRDESRAYYSTSCSAYTQYENDAENKMVKGYYYLTVYPSKVYNITAEANGVERGVVNYNPGTANHTLNFTLPVYKVTLNVPAGLDLTGDGLYIKGTEGSKYVYGNSVYLKKGTYVINTTRDITTGTGFNERTDEYKIAAKFTVNGNMAVNVSVAKTGNGYNKYSIDGTLTVGTESQVYRNEYYYFTPTEDGQYTFTTNSYQAFTIYDMNKDIIEYADEIFAGESYTTSATLKKGTQYVIYCEYSGAVKATLYSQEAPAVEGSSTEE